MDQSNIDNNRPGQNAIANRPSDKRVLVEFKNGKVIFKQKSISFEKLSDTLQDIVKFRELIEQRVERQDPPLTVIPREYRPVIVKLAHESDKTVAALTKHIRHELLPAQDEDEEADPGAPSPASAMLPLDAVESAIKAVVTRTNYGVDSAGKVPAALCVWRWEVKEEYRDWLPKAAREKADARLAERVQAKKDLAALFETLLLEERNTLLDPKSSHKVSPKETNKTDNTNNSGMVGLSSPEPKSTPQQAQKQGKKADDSENDASSETPKPSRKKPSDPEKAAKEKEKLEKKAAKVEREKKAQEAQNKSRSLMANFFGKKPAARVSPAQDATDVQSDFEKTFKRFVLKKDAELAPINWFAKAEREGRSGSGKSEMDVIVIDDEDREVKDEPADVVMEDVERVNMTQMSERERLHTILASLPPSASRHHPRPLTDTTTRALITQLTEAEVAGDTASVRTLLGTLRSRTLLPAKVFIFTEDVRPGYFGTWTRTSRIVMPRRPFARDVIARDYSCDSGEEWDEEPEEGEGVEDGEGEEEEGVEEVDSDLDSWLVDDDDEEVPVGEDMPVEPMLPPPSAPPKRKVEAEERKLEKKRKVVVPLVPFAKGPCWEAEIGCCEHDTFKPYRIRLFNDTPYPIDPFTFVSTCSLDSKPNGKDSSSTETVFAVPSLPKRLISSTTTGTATADLTSTPTSAPPKRTASTPKTAFPTAHLALLLDKIGTLATGNITFIVESVYAQLHGAGEKVKKNAIEAKVREVGEKCRERRVWVVKEGHKITSAGGQS